MDVLKELEQAALVAMAPPQKVSAEERRKAETVVLNFRKTPNAYSVCNVILEHSKNDIVLFEAANTMKECAMKEWDGLEKGVVEGICSFLLNYVLKRPSLTHFVREQIVRVIALLIKRGSSTITQDIQSSFLCMCEDSIASNDNNTNLVCCSLLRALVIEYASTKDSSDVGLGLGVHCEMKQNFETNHLQRILILATHVLKNFVNVPLASLSRQALGTLSSYLSLCELIFQWQFGSSHLINKTKHQLSAGGGSVTLFRPPVSWKQTILNHSFLELFYQLLATVLGNEDLTHVCLQCLIQLASLSGQTVQSQNLRRSYLSSFISKGLLQFLQRSHWTGLEAFGCASIANRLFLVFAVSDFVEVPDTQLKILTSVLAERTVQFQVLAAKAEQDSLDDCRYQDAVDDLLNVWMTLVASSHHFKDGYLATYAVNIFNAYIKTHLSPPEGSRVISQKEKGEDIDCEVEEDDRITYSDTLDNIGVLGRQALSHSLVLLSDLLSAKLQVLGSYVSQLNQGPNPEAQPHADNLYEDIHWLLLITTHVLTSYGCGESHTIPSEIVKFGKIELQSGHVSVDSSIQHFLRSELATSHNGVDKVVQLFSCALQLVKIEIYALQNGLAFAFSPEVACTLLSFLQRFVASYLLPQKSIQTQMNDVLAAIFGSHEGCTSYVVQTLLDLCEVNCLKWASEPVVAEETGNLLLQLVKNEECCRIVLKYPHLWRIGGNIGNSNEGILTMPPNARSLLIQAVVVSGTTVDIKDVNEKFQVQFLTQLKDKYSKIRHRPDFLKLGSNEIVRLELLHCLDWMKGIALATDQKNCGALNDFLHPFLEDLVSIFKACKDIAEIRDAILELFRDIVQAQLCYLDKVTSERLLYQCLHLARGYAKYCKEKIVVRSFEEEEQVTDILLFISIFTQILAKDLFDLSNDLDSNNSLLADTVIIGLGAVIPVMSTELLKFPNLSNEYFQLVSYICEKYPNRVFSLSGDLQQGIAHSIEFAMKNSISQKIDITGSACVAVKSLARHDLELQRQGRTNTLWNNCMKHFLKVALDVFVLNEFDFDILETAADALFYLICSNLQDYQNLVQHFILGHSNLELSSRLSEAFSSLTPSEFFEVPVEEGCPKFRRTFEVFLPKVKGFLLVK